MRMLLPLLFALAVEFDVASIKPAAPVTGHFQYHMTMQVDGTRVDIINASIAELVATAYRVISFQISGPDWMRTEKFDVAAKLPDGTSKDQVPEMLQALLAGRFKLVVHRDRPERSVRALVVAKGGAKLKESPAGSDGSGWTRSMGPDGSMHMDTKGMTMQDLARMMAMFLDAPVVDATEIKGSYDVPLDFAPDDLRNGANSYGVAVPADAHSESSGSSIGQSLQRVGLKLEGRRLPVDIVMVDHVEKVPTGN